MRASVMNAATVTKGCRRPISRVADAPRVYNCFCISKVMEIWYMRGGEAQVAREIHHPSTDAIDLATVLRALGDPARLTMVRLLADGGELSCTEIQERLDMPVSTCSYHLRLLR